MKNNIKQAINLVAVYCGKSEHCFNQFIWRLSGNAKRTVRKHILEVLTERKVLSKDAGINNLQRELFTALNITGDCEAERIDNFANKAKEIYFSFS